MNLQAIYTEKNNCQDCYKCIRQCPVKAIKMKNHSASIINDLCIECGHCILICPIGAKRFRDDTKAVKMLLKTGVRVIASLAPSYAAEYGTDSKNNMISALKKLGFWKVSETAIGADLYNQSATQFLDKKAKGLFFSSCCPSVVSLIRKYYPQHLNKIMPLQSPMYLHAQYLKEHYGPQIKVVFIGPCIAKKCESTEKPGWVDAALTYKELNNWFEEEHINLDEQLYNREYSFEPISAQAGSLYPIDGGLINGLTKTATKNPIRTLAFSEVNNIKNILNNLTEDDGNELTFVELMACSGGCINGPTAQSQRSLISKISATQKQFHQVEKTEEVQLHKSDAIEHIYSPFSLKVDQEPDEKEMNEVLTSVGKTTEKDELNCSGCGYESCRHFARALILGKAERSMCVSYMRKVANNKASVLLQKMPYGVFMVDEKLKIIESNYPFAKILGPETEELFTEIPGLEGAYLDLLIPSQKLFANFLSSGEESMEKDIRINKKIFHISLFTIQKHKILCGIIQHLNTAEVLEDEIVKRTQAVIRENLSTVQKVAYLLGENASRTEVVLNSIIESHNKPKGND